MKVILGFKNYSHDIEPQILYYLSEKDEANYKNILYILYNKYPNYYIVLKDVKEFDSNKVELPNCSIYEVTIRNHQKELFISDWVLISSIKLNDDCLNKMIIFPEDYENLNNRVKDIIKIRYKDIRTCHLILAREFDFNKKVDDIINENISFSGKLTKVLHKDIENRRELYKQYNLIKF